MKETIVAPASFERAYYEENYRNYNQQNPDRKLRHYKQAVESSLRGRERIRILDIGCAFGAFLGTLGEGWDAYGMDVSEYAIDAARKTVPGARFESVRDGRIPFDVPFDAITAWDVIEHIPDLDDLAREIAANLADDGVFVFVVPVYDGPLGPVVRVLDGDPTHVHKKSRRFWLDWAGRHFHVERWGCVSRAVPGRLLRPLADSTIALLRARHRGRHTARPATPLSLSECFPTVKGCH
jgi:SAM-dependent methyltransferase